MAVNTPESSDFEGYLEKHGTGTVSKLLGKQKKTWCFLQGAWLYCHQSNNKRSSVVSSIDLTEAQMIRKINSDKSGLQFEIVTKFKNIIFTAGSTDECNEWIKQLQKAMTFKDNLNVLKTEKKSPNLHHYDEIDINHIHKTPVQHTSSSSQYEDIDKFQTSVSSKAETSGHYASIDDDDVFTTKNDDDKSSLTKQSVSDICEYSTVIPKEQRKTPPKDNIPSSQKPIETCSKQKNFIENTNARKDSQKENTSTERSISETQNQDQTAVHSSKEDIEEKLESEEESIDDIHSMIPKNFPELKEELYSLTEDDIKPITDLKTFLHINNLDKRPLKQISTATTEMTDPFESLKAYLKSLDL